MSPKRCRAIGGYAPGARWSASGRFHPACVLYSQERRPRSVDAYGLWEIGCGGQGALASCLSCAINVEPHPMVSLSIPLPTRFLLLLQRPGHQIFEKHHAQCLNHWLVQRSEKATECLAVGEVFSAKESHERGSE